MRHRSRPFANALNHCAVDGAHRRRRFLIHGRRLGRKIGRAIRFLDLGLLIRFDLDQTPRCQPVGPVGGLPHPAPNCVRHVIQRQRVAARESPTLAVHLMIVVELRLPYPQRDVENPHAVLAL